MVESEDLSSAPPPASSPSDGSGLNAASQPPPAKTQVAAWADELSGYVIDGVAWLRAMTTVRALTAMRALVYGIVVIVAAGRGRRVRDDRPGAYLGCLCPHRAAGATDLAGVRCVRRACTSSPAWRYSRGSEAAGPKPRAGRLATDDRLKRRGTSRNSRGAPWVYEHRGRCRGVGEPDERSCGAGFGAGWSDGRPL